MQNDTGNDSTESGQGINRRKYVSLAGAATVAGTAGCLGDIGIGEDDDEFPSENFRAIISFGEGGGTDIYMRQIWGHIAETRDVSVEFENIPGAGGLQGASEFSNADPDGHTIAPFNAPGDIIPAMIEQPDFDFGEFRGIAAYAIEPLVVVSNPDEDVADFEEMVSRYEDGEFENIGGMQPGTQINILAVFLRDNADFQIPWDSYVPYDGSGETGQMVASGEVPIGIVTASTAVDLDDRVDVVAAFTEGGADLLGVESHLDHGYPNIDFLGEITRVNYAPPETPDDRVEWLDEAVEEAVMSDELQNWADEGGIHLEYVGGHEFVDDLTTDAIEQISEEIDLDEFR